MASKSTSAARSSTVAKKSAPVVVTKVTKNGKAGPTPPASTSKKIDPNDCTVLHTELAVKNGEVALAVAGGGKTTWHGYGQEILPTDTLEQIAKKAHIDFKVASTRVLFKGADGKMHEMDGWKVNYRTDDHTALGVVSDQFKNVQPIEILDFFREFCKKNKISMETAGALRKGRTVWAMAKLGKDFDFMLPGNDKVVSYLRLQTGFDGKRATDAVATAVRQVCKNTENMINAQSNAYRVPHTSMFDAKALQAAMGLLGEQYKVTAEFYNALVKRKVTNAERDKYFCDLFGIEVSELNAVDKDKKPIVHARTKNMLAELTAAFTNSPGAGLKSADGTAYGLLQAVTYWTDYKASSNDIHKEGKDSARQTSAWFGLGSRTKVDAQYLAAELAGCEELIAA